MTKFSMDLAVIYSWNKKNINFLTTRWARTYNFTTLIIFPPHSLSALASLPHLSRITVISSSWWRPPHRPHPIIPLRPWVGWHPLPDVGREPVRTCSVWARAWSLHTDSALVQQYKYFSSFVAHCWLKSKTKQGKLNVVPALCTQV